MDGIVYLGLRRLVGWDVRACCVGDVSTLVLVVLLAIVAHLVACWLRNRKALMCLLVLVRSISIERWLALNCAN